MSIPVVAQGSYAVALAELPLRTHSASTITGSIVVVSGGTGWASRLRRAVDEGAAAVILAEPRGVEIVALGSLTVPVVVDRPRLRFDIVTDARPGSTPRAVQVECGAPAAELSETLRDAVGWARALAGGALEVRAVSATSRATLLALDHGTVAVSVLVGRRDSPAAWMRALALDSERIEVTLQHPVGSPLVARAGVGGTVLSPLRFESHERLALRRALDALETETLPADLQELEHDCRTAVEALG